MKVASTYTATAATPGAAEPFRMQATDLGRYLFYGPTPDFMARNVLNGVAPAAQPSNDADWTVTEDGSDFRITNEAAGRDLVVDGVGLLTTVPAGTGGAAGLFNFAATTGCADYPEIEVNVTGPLPASHPAGSTVTGTVETHMHGMAFEFLGTKAHCGRPWDRFGAPFALEDCPDHGNDDDMDTPDPNPEGCSAPLENAISGTTCHDTDGWPTFAGWPTHQQLTHEQSYYRWIERSWRSGLRIWVNLMVENRVLCEIYPLTPPPSTQNCNEMDSVRRQIKDIHKLQDYIDAQWGGPGKGWYRIVESPKEARAVINDGKLAVIKGMEVSEPFNCRLLQPGDMPLCSESGVDAGIDELYDLGLRQLEIVNKFDNALTGVAGDSGNTGTVTNLGNLYSAGTFWDYEDCPAGPDDPAVNHDHSPTALSHNDDQIIANGLDAFGNTTGITFPVYGTGPQCNQRGFSDLGEHALRRMMSKGMIFDPDHMSVLARNRALDVVEEVGYPGVMTSHSWSTDNALPRISRLGGLIGPAAKSPDGFVADWQHIRDHGYDDLNPYTYGFGYGADMNGFASQGGPPPPAGQVTYPFQSPIDPTQTVHQQVSGTKTYDYNVTGTAHYGMYADWAESVSKLGGPEIVADMKNGAEAYLQMWERTERAAAALAGAGAPNAGVPTAGQGSACATLHSKLKRVKSKKAKRKLRKKLRKRGCLPKKKKKKRKRKRR